MRKQRRRWWTRLVTVLAVLTVTAATLSALFRLALDAVPGYRHDVETFVARSVGHPTRIGAIGLTWHHLRPTLELHDIAMYDADSGATLLETGGLRLGFGLLKLLHGRYEPGWIELNGLDLDADVDANGVWRLRGFEPRGNFDWRAMLNDFGRFDDIRLENCRLRLHDRRIDPDDAQPLPFKLASASIHRDESRYKAGLVLTPPAGVASRLQLNAVLDGALSDPSSWHGAWRLAIDRVVGWPWLAPLLAPGVNVAFNNASLLLDGEVDAGRVRQAVLTVQAASAVARDANRVRAQLAALHWRTRVESGGDGSWHIVVEQLNLLNRRGAWSLTGADAARSADGAWTLHAEQLKLDAIAPWLALARALPPSLSRVDEVSGALEQLTLTLTPTADDSAPTLAVNAHLNALALGSEGGTSPGFSGLSGTLDAGARQGTLRLDERPLHLQLPAVFERRVDIENPHGAVRWRRDGDGWIVEANGVALRVPGAAIDGNARLRLADDPETPPHLALQLKFASSDAAQLKPLLPKTWGPNARDWLRRALHRARAKGTFAVDAPLTPPAPDGRETVPWQLDVDLADADIDYAPGWPGAHKVAAALKLRGGALDIALNGGEIGGTRLTAGHARMTDLTAPDLHVDGHLIGDAAQFYRVLRASPVAPKLQGLLGGTDASGPLELDLALKIPLAGDGSDIALSGVAAFNGADLHVSALDEPIHGFTGRVAFDDVSVRSDGLNGRLYGTPVNATIRPESAIPGGVLASELTLGLRDGLAQAMLPSWLGSALNGSARLRLRLPLAGADAGRMTLTSDLRGVESTLPAPFAKSTDATLPLTISSSGEGAAARTRIQLGEVLRAALRFDERGQHARGLELRLGAGDAPRADGDGIVIRGALAEFDAGAWLNLITGVQGGNGLAFNAADLAVEHLRYHRLGLGRTHLSTSRGGDGAVMIRAEGAAEGLLEWRSAAGGALRARLQRLTLDALPPLPETEATTPEASPFDPAAAPTLALDFNRVTLGEVDLGHFQLQTARVADGQRIEQLRLDGGRLVVDAHGSWLRHSSGGEAGSSAELAFRIQSSAIAEVLKVFGYAPNLRAADARFEGRLNWPRVPAGLELSQAHGQIDLDLHRGALSTVKPGAGRVLGLFNLYALPRRLQFDFRDVVSKGLSFDTIKGQFQLADGNANTDDLEIKGASLRLLMKGRIGLAARDYDQRITVYPDFSTSVAVGATLIGGPIAGGLVLLGQQLFSKPFSKLGKFSYRVTGSWDNPEVIKGADEAPPPPATGAPHG